MGALWIIVIVLEIRIGIIVSFALLEDKNSVFVSVRIAINLVLFNYSYRNSSFSVERYLC